MPDEAGKGGQQDGGGQKAGDSVAIKIGEETKVFKAEDVAHVLEKSGKLEKTVESLSNFQKVLTQYGVNSDEYLRNSEAAFALANSLIQKGVIDEQGNIIEKKGGGGGEEEKKKFFAAGGDTGTSKQLEVIAKALQTLGSKVEQIEEGQSNLFRRNISRDVKALHPNLNDDDVSKLLAKAQADKTKGFWDHTQVFAQEKTAGEKAQKQVVVKEVVEILTKAGIIPEGKVDLAKLDLNALKEQSPEGAPPVYEGKKFMFTSRKRRLAGSGVKLEGFTTPAEGMKQMFDSRR